MEDAVLFDIRCCSIWHRLEREREREYVWIYTAIINHHQYKYITINGGSIYIQRGWWQGTRRNNGMDITQKRLLLRRLHMWQFIWGICLHKERACCLDPCTLMRWGDSQLSQGTITCTCGPLQHWVLLLVEVHMSMGWWLDIVSYVWGEMDGREPQHASRLWWIEVYNSIQPHNIKTG